METRITPRLNISLKVETKISAESGQGFALAGGSSFTVEAVDISELGLGIIFKCFLPKGLILELSINGEPFGLNEVIKIKGEVRHCRFLKDVGYRCGIKFLSISEVYRKAIAKFIEECERRKAPRIKLSD